MALFHHDLLEGQVFPVLKGPGGQHQQVAGQQHRAAVWNDGLLPPGDHDHQQVGGERELLQGLAVPGMIFVQVDFDEVDVALLLVVVEGLAYVGGVVDHVQLGGDAGEQAALEGDGQQDDAEHQVEQVVAGLRPLEDRHNGEHDGGHAPEPGPGHHPHLSRRGAEGQHQDRDHRGPGHKGEKHHDGQGGQQHRGQLHRGHQQAQQEEDEHLGHVGDHVEEVDQVALLGQLGAAHVNAAQVGAQIAVAPQHGGQGVGEDDHRKDKDGLALLRGEHPPAQAPDGQLAQEQAAQGADGDLLHQEQGDKHVLSSHDAHRHGGKHVGDGVVGARLDLQQGVGVVLQGQLLGAQDVEHRGRVGGGDHRADEKALHPGQPQDQVGKDGHRSGGSGHSQGGQHHRLDHHGPGGVQVGAEAAVEHNENQAGRADHVGGVIVVKGNSEQAVFSKAHPKGDKDQQGRDGQTVQIPPHQRTQQDHTAHQQQSFIHRSVLLCTGQPQLFYSLELIINITICLL